MSEDSFKDGQPVSKEYLEYFKIRSTTDVLVGKVVSFISEKFWSNPWFIRLISAIQVAKGYVPRNFPLGTVIKRYDSSNPFLQGKHHSIQLEDVGLYGREYVDFMDQDKENRIYILFMRGDEVKTIWLEVDVENYGFWPSVKWSKEWTPEEKAIVAEVYLGGYFDLSGNLKPLPGALGTGPGKAPGEYSEEEALAYCRERRGVDFGFLCQWKQPSDLVVSYAQESLGLTREYAPEAFHSFCKMIWDSLSLCGHPIAALELRNLWVKMLNVLPILGMEPFHGGDSEVNLEGGASITVDPAFGCIWMESNNQEFVIASKRVTYNDGSEDFVWVYGSETCPEVLVNCIVQVFGKAPISEIEWEDLKKHVSVCEWFPEY